MVVAVAMAALLGGGGDKARVVGAMIAGIANSQATNAFLVGRKRNLSVVDARRPVFSIMANVKVMKGVRSGLGTSPRVATRWILAILDHKSSMGSSRFHASESEARLRSNSSGVIMVPYLVRRCSNMAKGVTSPDPKSGSSRSLRNDALTAVRIWAVSAARRLLYNVTSASCSVRVDANGDGDDSGGTNGSRGRAGMDRNFKCNSNACDIIGFTEEQC